MSTDKSVYGLVTPEENLISILSGYVYGGRPMLQSTLVGVLQLLKQQKEDIARLNQQLSAKTISEQNIINAFGIKGEGAHSKLIIEYVSGLVAENSQAMTTMIAMLNAVPFCDHGITQQAIWDDFKATREAVSEIKAQGVDAVLRALVTSDGDDFTDAPAICANVAANLRAGRKG